MAQTAGTLQRTERSERTGRRVGRIGLDTDIGLQRTERTERTERSGRAGRAGPRRARRVAEAGQATAEYALVLLGVALIAVLVLDWARNTNMVSRLLNAVFRSISKLIT